MSSPGSTLGRRRLWVKCGRHRPSPAAHTLYMYLYIRTSLSFSLPPLSLSLSLSLSLCMYACMHIYYGCIAMQRYWSPLWYSFLRTLFLLAADLRRHPSFGLHPPA